MILLEILQEEKSVYVNLDNVVSVTEDPDDANKSLLWTSFADDGECFIANEPVWDLVERIKAECLK